MTSKQKMALLFCIPVNSLNNIENMIGQQFNIAGIISEVDHKISKKGNNWCQFTLDDYSGAHQINIFGQEYEDFKHFLVPFLSVRIKVNIGTFYNSDDAKINFEKFEFLRDVSDEINRISGVMKYIKNGS